MQRFGPLNVKGGERRLNVAVTRVKYNVSIVSSIRYTDIKTNTSSKGALLLRDYLQFAENVVAAKNYTEEYQAAKSASEFSNRQVHLTIKRFLPKSSTNLAIQKSGELVLLLEN